MSQVTEYRLDLRTAEIPEVIHVSQGDTGWRNLTFRLFFDGEPFLIPENAWVWFQYRKQDGEMGITMMEADGSTATLETDDSITEVSGTALCRIQLVNGSERIVSPVFTMIVEPDPIHGISDDDMSTDGVDNQILYLNVGPYVLDGILYNLPNPSVTDEILKGVL